MKTSEVAVQVRAERVRCADGLSMATDLYFPVEPGGLLPVTVLCHGFKGFRSWGMFPHLARRLAGLGRVVVLFDYSHNGIGDQPDVFSRLDLFERQTISRHVEDLGTVLDLLDDTGLQQACSIDTSTSKVFAVGHSMGAAVALLRGLHDLRVSGLACLNGISHWQRMPPAEMARLEREGRVLVRNTRTGQDMPLGRAWFDDVARIDLAAAAQELTVPTLVLQGTQDETVLPSEGEALADWIPGAIHVAVPGGDHTFGARHPWQGWTPALEFVVEQLDAFLPACEA